MHNSEEIMYIIRKQFTFSAAHHLYNLPLHHPCARPHGHNYIVEVLLKSSVLTQKEKWVVDYRDLDEFGDFLKEEIDHRDLNEIMKESQTTAEELARFFFHWCKGRWDETFSVRVSETAKTWAEYFEE